MRFVYPPLPCSSPCKIRSTRTIWASSRSIHSLVAIPWFSILDTIAISASNAPADARIEDYLGKRQQATSTRDAEMRALIRSAQEKAEAFERDIAALSQLTGG